jgi:spore coat protein CotH
MSMRLWSTCLMTVYAASFALAQPPDGGFPFGPGGSGGRGFGPGQQQVKLLEKFDKDGDGILNTAERKAAREYLATQQQGRGPGRGGRAMFGRGGAQEAVTPGPKLNPADVKAYGSEPLYDVAVLRTLFLEFEDADWEKELADFYHTDVEVPAGLTVDGRKFESVGVKFRGASSYMSVPEGRKRSLSISINFTDDGQRLGGYRTLNLLNSHQDPTFLRTALYMHIARQYVPAPKVNYMRVVINGESWGVYVNSEHFNSDFTNEWFGTTKGARWKVPGSPMGRGGLNHLGDDPAAYKRIYEIKSKEDPKAWADLIRLCKTLSQTPADQLEKALEPQLDIDGALKFLALDKAMINNDGYWVRMSDYSIYQDVKGRFHVIPHDANETLQPTEGGPGGGGRGGRASSGFGPPPDGFGPPPDGFPGFGPGGRGPGGGGPPGGGGRVDLDPFEGSDAENKPLISKLLAVPSLRAKYLGYVREIGEKWLDWNRLGPLARQYQAVIAEDVKRDTRKLNSTESFSEGVAAEKMERGGMMGPGAGPSMSLKVFAEKRRAYLLDYVDVRKAARP